MDVILLEQVHAVNLVTWSDRIWLETGQQRDRQLSANNFLCSSVAKKYVAP